MRAQNKTMNKQKQLKFEQLKLLITLPRLYIANYFSDLRAEVDLAFVKQNLIEQNIKNWTEIIAAISQFEIECLKQQPNNQLGEHLTQIASKQIELMEHKLTSNDLLDEKDDLVLNEQLFKIEKIVFKNKTLIFLEKPCLKLLVIKNEYLARGSIENFKNK